MQREETSDLRVFSPDVDESRVVSVTVRELRCLCTDEWEYCASDEDDSDISIHERTCHFVFRDESYSTPDGYERDGTYYCSACGCDLPDWMQEHVDDIQAGNIDNDIDRCPISGARVVGE